MANPKEQDAVDADMVDDMIVFLGEAKAAAAETGESVLQIIGPSGRINRAIWGPLNKTIISAGEDATIRIWDSETGQLVKESDRERGHQKAVTSISKSADGSYFLTGSLDKSAKLWDTRSLTLIKTYVTESPVNACTMSPLLNHGSLSQRFFIRFLRKKSVPLKATLDL